MTKDIHLNKFVTFKPLGLFGNQMFQIAATIGYAKKHGISYRLPKWFTDGFDLSEIFKGPFGTVDQIETEEYRYYDMYYTEIPKSEGNLRLDGYFQNEKYFKGAEVEIFEIFRPKIESNFREWNVSGDVCSLHVRRGDYLKYPLIHTNLSKNYYEAAIEIMKSNGFSTFLIFSDDIEWCKQNFIGGEFIFSENRTNYQDLVLMSSCDSHIIANSSFSWWGAWLGKNPDKIVVAPDTWFGPEGPNPYEIVPEKWIKI